MKNWFRMNSVLYEGFEVSFCDLRVQQKSLINGFGLQHLVDVSVSDLILFFLSRLIQRIHRLIVCLFACLFE